MDHNVKLESARALKLEISDAVVRRNESMVANLLLDVALPGLFALSAVGRPLCSLGIAKGNWPGDYRLAVRVEGKSASNAGFLAYIQRATNGEFDIRCTGPVGKLAESGDALWPRSRHRPLVIGVPVGHSAVSAGTLGCFAIHRPTGRAVLVSNNHVLADEDRASPGDPILQPAGADGGKGPDDQIAELLVAEPLKPTENIVDVAVGSLVPSVTFDPVSLTGSGNLRGMRQPQLEPGDPVLKIGRSSGLTFGIVTAIELDSVAVAYDTGTHVFDRQIEIEGTGSNAFSASGDSGSMIVDESGLACGLLFAGSEHGGTNGKGLTFANDIHQVFATLHLELASTSPGA
nr:hypothetical protein [uncultured Rhodopila sp.]